MLYTGKCLVCQKSFTTDVGGGSRPVKCDGCKKQKKTLPARACGCGCGKMFSPAATTKSRDSRKYATDKCRAIMKNAKAQATKEERQRKVATMVEVIVKRHSLDDGIVFDPIITKIPTPRLGIWNY